MKSSYYDQALAEASAFHAAGRGFPGFQVLQHAERIGEILRRYDCRTLLDYGAGKGLQYSGHEIHRFWGVDVECYDPAWPPFARELEGVWDAVLCSHSLACVPAADLPRIASRVRSLARRVAIVAERVGPVKKRVFSRRELMPIGWGEEQWARVLAPRSVGEVEVVLIVAEGDQTRERTLLCT